MTTTVVADRCADILRYLANIFNQQFDIKVLQGTIPLNCRIKFVDIGLMMLCMVYFHGFCIKTWFKRIIRKGKSGNV